MKTTSDNRESPFEVSDTVRTRAGNEGTVVKVHSYSPDEPFPQMVDVQWATGQTETLPHNQLSLGEPAPPPAAPVRPQSPEPIPD